MFSTYHVATLSLSLLMSFSAAAQAMKLTSNDIAQGQFMDKKQEFTGFGCSGDNQSPHLQWANPPKGTKSFAVTVYDPDAPTGSGWWHWQVVNIPATARELPANVGHLKSDKTHTGSASVGSTFHQNLNDYGQRAFGGACPPVGHGVHHYRFTLHALSVETLDLPENASGALAGYMINANTIERATIEALYQRQ